MGCGARPWRASNRLRRALADDARRADRACDALEILRPQLLQLEQAPQQPARGRGHHDRPGLGQGLQPRREVRRLADDLLLLRRTLADQFAHDHEAGGDPDPGRQGCSWPKAMGATVVITSSSDGKLERARTLGADHTINYRQHQDWGSRVLDWTGGRGVDHVVEVGGPGTLAQSITAVRIGGHIALIGVLTGLGRGPARLMRKQARLRA